MTHAALAHAGKLSGRSTSMTIILGVKYIILTTKALCAQGIGKSARDWHLQLGRKALCAQGIGKSARDWDVQTKGGG